MRSLIVTRGFVALVPLMQAIAAEFEEQAKELEAQAALHRDMAKYYAVDEYAHQPKPSLQEHCEELSADLRHASRKGPVAEAESELMMPGTVREELYRDSR